MPSSVSNMRHRSLLCFPRTNCDFAVCGGLFGTDISSITHRHHATTTCDVVSFSMHSSVSNVRHRSLLCFPRTNCDFTVTGGLFGTDISSIARDILLRGFVTSQTFRCLPVFPTCDTALCSVFQALIWGFHWCPIKPLPAAIMRCWEWVP